MACARAAELGWLDKSPPLLAIQFLQSGYAGLRIAPELTQ
jgi:hypothetical protein